jgi:hypothetical protein
VRAWLRCRSAWCSRVEAREDSDSLASIPCWHYLDCTFSLGSNVLKDFPHQALVRCRGLADELVCSKLVHLGVVFTTPPTSTRCGCLLSICRSIRGSPRSSPVLPQDSNRLSLFPSSGQRHGSLKPVLRLLHGWRGLEACPNMCSAACLPRHHSSTSALWSSFLKSVVYRSVAPLLCRPLPRVPCFLRVSRAGSTFFHFRTGRPVPHLDPL